MGNIDWSNPDWAYLLGVVHGDGCVAPRSIDIAVGYKDAEYADSLIALWRRLGYEPKVYRPRSALKLSFHSAALARVFRQFKSKGIWSLPEHLSLGHWLAGVFDTDGCVSLASKKCAVVITLKRSGNLQLVADALEQIGTARPTVHNRVSKFNGKDYKVEELRLTSFANILAFSKEVYLRHPRKKQRLLETISYIDAVQSVVPLWKQIAEYCKEPRTWKEIATQFSITKDQVDSALQRIKAEREVEIIPPPEALTRYLVKDQS